jgi:prolipoprotein diacylglyceryltransferase
LSSFGFVAGAILWAFLFSVFTQYYLPFSLICDIFMATLVAGFAFKRREIRELWYGNFYDKILLIPKLK